MPNRKIRPLCLVPLLGLALLAGCRSSSSRAPETPRPEAVSLLGQPLFRPEVQPPERREELQAELEAARAAYEADPASEDAAVWLGRRLAYLGRYQDAVAVWSQALELHPQSVALLRHRGHRFITLRQLDEALEDLKRAEFRMRGLPDAVEPDGMPNAAGVPRSTLRTNVFYHLALAHYLSGAYAMAASHWRGCADAADNDDMRVAAHYWRALCLARLGMQGELDALLAEIHPTMDVLENTDYHRLLLHFKWRLAERELLMPLEPGTVSYATVAYGVGAWKLVHGEPEPARALFQQLVAGPTWPAFGHIAAEAELARLAR